MHCEEEAGDERCSKHATALCERAYLETPCMLHHTPTVEHLVRREQVASSNLCGVSELPLSPFRHGGGLVVF